ncbi:hypothetical protein T12_15226, partial [Trichinella patagoniensis]
MFLRFFRLQSCASDSYFWFQKGVIIIEAFSNCCRFGKHVQSNYAARAIIAVPKKCEGLPLIHSELNVVSTHIPENESLTTHGKVQ